MAHTLSRREILAMGAAALPGLSEPLHALQAIIYDPRAREDHYLKPLRETAEALKKGPNQTLETLKDPNKTPGGDFNVKMTGIIEWATNKQNLSRGNAAAGTADVHLPSGPHEGGIILSVLLQERAIVAHRISAESGGDLFPGQPRPQDRAGVFTLNENSDPNALYAKAEAAIESERARRNLQLRRSPIQR